MTRPTSLLLRFALILVSGAVAFSLVGLLLIPGVFGLRGGASFEPASQIALPELLEGSRILDRHGNPMGELVGAENRQVVPLEAISEEMVATVLAIEDADFYEHRGVNARSVLRAARANQESGEISQGGSTITQQLVKLSLVGTEQTLTRKLKEASLAVQLENQFCGEGDRRECKDRILEQYLNLVYLGRGAYGVQAAAQLYFGIDASDIGWAEATVLTSLIRNPNGADPIEYPDVARERRSIVLARLQSVGLVTEQQAALISLAQLPTSAAVTPSAAASEDLDYFERKVRDELLDAEWLASSRELRRHLIFNGGLTITSTFDPVAQEFAEEASANNPVAARNPETVAVVAAVEPANGAVRAVVGETVIPGRGVVEVATPAVGRSPGSSFKTFTLIAALEQGHSLRDSISASPAPTSLYDDWGIEARTWPSGCSGGSVTLLRATASSNNCAFARLQAAIGGDDVIDVASRMGITTIDESDDVPSMTLGGGVGVRPLEMAAAYATIANDGRYNAPHFVTRVEDRDGNVLYEHEPENERVISIQVARQATEALRAVVTGGTYGGGSLPDRRPAAGKTGTNEGADGRNTDVWFVGFTPQLSTAVWIGNPAGTTEIRGGRVQGGTTAARVWREFMAGYHEDLEVLEFEDALRVRRSSYIKDPWSRFPTRWRARSTTATTAPPTSAAPAPETPAAEPAAAEPAAAGDGGGGGAPGGSPGEGDGVGGPAGGGQGGDG